MASKRDSKDQSRNQISDQSRSGKASKKREPSKSGSLAEEKKSRPSKASDSKNRGRKKGSGSSITTSSGTRRGAAGQKKIFIKGLTLGAKFSIIALVSVIITVSVALIIASSTKSYIEAEIKKDGINAVNIYANFSKILIYSHLTGEEKRIVDLEKNIIDSHIKFDAKEMISPLSEFETAIVQANFIITENGIHRKIHELNRESIHEGGRTSKLGLGRILHEKDGLKIARGTYNNSPALIFEKTVNLESVINPKLKQETSYVPTQGKARIYMSPSRVDEAINSIYILTAFVLIVSIAFSIAVAFFLSRKITKPIIQLVDDMKIVSRGNLDYQSECTSKDEVGFLATTFNNLTNSLKMAKVAEIEQEKLEHDLSVGRDIQKNLLPKSLYKIPGYDLEAFYLAAKEVGGDYYDLIPVDKKKLGIIVADVSGKGIQGAMIMTIMRTIMNIAAVGNASCKDCLTKTNRFLSDRLKRGMFVTAFYAILDCKTNKLEFVSAGHNPMVIYRAATKKVELLNPPGIALGFDKGPLFERTLKEGETILNPGDRFILYTDGVVESMNAAQEEYTDPRFHQFVEKHANEDSKTFTKNLVDELRVHQGEAVQHDDITIVTFRKL